MLHLRKRHRNANLGAATGGAVDFETAAHEFDAFAQDNYPFSPVRLVVGFPPGGTVDVVSRLVAQKLTRQMNTNVFVENKPGASGNIGAEVTAASKPDGYTLLVNTPAMVLSVAKKRSPGFQPASEARLGADGDVVIVGAGLAGLFTALKLAPMPVTVLAAAPRDSSTRRSSVA